MTEKVQAFEGSRPTQEYGAGDHDDFVGKRTDDLSRRTRKVLGLELMATGSMLGLVGIGDFITGSEVSRTLMQINLSNAPEIVAWAVQYMAQLQEVVKLGAGSSMIAIGTNIVDQLKK